MRLGRHEEAVAPFRKALRLRPLDPITLGNLGNTLCAQGRPAGAIPHLEAALQAEPSAAMHDDLGKALLASGRADEAAGQFRQALRIRPGFTEAEENLRRAQEPARAP